MRSRVTNKLLEAFPIDIQDLYEKAGESLPHSAKRWWWCWGGIVGLIFGLQVAISMATTAAMKQISPSTKREDNIAEVIGSDLRT